MGNVKKQPKVKEPIKIRFKPMRNGNKSIFLDTYLDGKRQKEYLKLYIIPERTPLDKEQNRKTLEIVKTIQSQQIVDLQKSEHGLSNTSNKKQKMFLVDYIRFVAESKKPQTKRSYDTLILFIQDFAPNTTLKQADKKFCLDFIDYLKNSAGIKTAKLSANTQVAYLRKLKVVFKRAVEDEIIHKNPLDTINRDLKPQNTTTEIPFLTIDEVKTLINTETPFDEVKTAYLFSCYTGLRFSDVKGLTWGRIREVNNETMLIYIQQKTKKQEYLPLAKPALELLANRTRTNDNDLIFELPLNNKANERLRTIAKEAGIDGKKVTFHTGRHTAATLLLSLGVSIEVVSKILGHADIRTTQIYAKVLAKQVKDGIHKLDNLF
ncbi:site-specific integrase [Bacteroidales bacterium OttesenSCG-928-B11]|nr:site-specific integrase [Bacteroidales bacterium OttesenSCG-928-E04]MDL2313145.1 site-specific integrase [Bacteroidales bacterium OttesenSCG-928-B11]MDL2326818.1 site-specific integrase [Bacteroidales bacterium OttesenSCG-928-A14]